MWRYTDQGSVHFTLNSVDADAFEPVLNRAESDVMSPLVTYHLTMSVLPFFLKN